MTLNGTFSSSFFMYVFIYSKVPCEEPGFSSVDRYSIVKVLLVFRASVGMEKWMVGFCFVLN